MKISKLLAIISCGAVLSASAISCHHKSDEDENEYLTGTLAYDLPEYLQSGTTLELVPTGVSDDLGNFPGIYWYTSENTARDTTRYEGDPSSVTGKYILEIPEDFYGTLTVTCTAYADGYYLRAQSNKTTVINEEKSLVINGLSDADPVFTDPRDNRNYRYVTIGNLDWFAANLAYAGGFPAYGSEFTRNIFGSFFTWPEALQACPDGWRLPSNADWKNLSDALGGTATGELDAFKNIAGTLMADAYFNDDKLWEFNTSVKLTAESKFNALPLGYANMDDGACDFHDFTLYSVFWSADEADAERAYYRYLYVSDPDMKIATGHKTSFAANVRCVRESL